MKAAKIKVTRKWDYSHVRPVDSLCVADVSGDTFICDLRNQMVYIDDNGKKVWDEEANFAPMKGAISDDGEIIYILSADGYLIKMTREAEILWDLWVDKKPHTLAAKSKGQAAVIGCLKYRFHVISGVGKRIRLVHTSEPVTYARFSGRGGELFVANAHGWVGIYDRDYKPKHQYNIAQPILKMEVTDNGKKIFLPARDEGLQVIEAESSQLATYSPGFSVIGVGIDRRGERIVAVGLDGDIAIMDSEGHVAWKTKADHSWVHCEMTRKGDRFTLLSNKGVVVCYKISTGKEAEEKDTGNNHFDFLEV